MDKRNKRILQILVHIGGWFPLVWLAWDFWNNNLTANPIQAVEQRTGKYALFFLVLSLACSPLVSIAGWKELIPRRKALGNYGFFYAFVHVLTFIGIDYGFNFNYIVRDVGTKSYILVGLTAFLSLAPLAITSFSYWMKRLGKNWKRLHRLVYLISPLVILHFALAVKGDITRLSGNLGEPLQYAFVVSLLLIARISFVKQIAINIRRSLARRLSDLRLA